jgi:F-type H+-transporting ATPase subunit epsilon
MPSIRCQVVAPTGVVFEGEIDSLKGPGWEGGFGVLKNHAPYLVRLVAGRLILQDDDGAETYGADITGGFLLIARNDCTVLVEGIREEDAA